MLNLLNLSLFNNCDTPNLCFLILFLLSFDDDAYFKEPKQVPRELKVVNF